MSLRRRVQGSVFVLPAAVLSASVLLPAALHAQFDSASVIGYVRDASGAGIAQSNVTLTNVDTGTKQSTRTDSSGQYEFDSVLIGNYQVEADSTGFSPSETSPFRLTVNARQRVDVDLKTGAVTEAVTVTSAPTLLETETSSRGDVILPQQIQDLPLNGRSYADLALLVPGVRKSFLENQSTSSREASFNVNGQRSAFNNFLLDGLDNNSYGTSNQGFANENIAPSPDAVGEFRIETDNYSAEYGRASGAVINATVRRGTNQFHGRAWDYLRNTDLNAIGPFTPTLGIKPTFIRNQFGGTFGGPIFRDHTFFFTDYEGVRQIFRNPSSTITLPNAEQRARTFLLHRVDGSTAPIPLFNPVTGTAYTTGTLPSTAATSFAQAVIAALPANTTPGVAYNSGLTNNYAVSPRGTINDDKGDARIDQTFSPRLSMFARYSQHQTSLFDPPTILGPAGGNANANVAIFNRQIVGGVTKVLTPNSLLDIRFEYSQNRGGKTPYNVGQQSLLVQNGITDGLPTDPTIVRTLNGQAITGFAQFGSQTSNPQFQNPNLYDPKINYTLVRGRNSYKLGYEFQAVNTQINDFNPSYGQDNYGSQYSGLTATGASIFPTCATPASTACVPTDTAAGNTVATQLQQARNLADFYFGNRSSYALTNFQIVNLRQRFNFVYLQDDIKVSSRLTVNAGIRYELVTPQYERDNKLANFDPRINSLVLAQPGDIYDRSLVNLPTKNVGPRFGLAYSALKNTVLRTGYAINYTQYNRAGGENNLTYNGPNVVNANISPQIYPTTTNRCVNDTQLQTTCFRQTQQGYSNILTSPAAFNSLLVLSRYIPRNFQTGYVQNYFFGVQQQLPGGVVIDLAYVGNKGTHLQILADYNQALPFTGTGTAPSLQARRPVSNFAGIEIAYGGGGSNYNAIQLKVEKRSGNGLYFINSFTYSRGFDLSSGHLETNNGDNSRVNYYNPRSDYGRSSYDQPLNNTTSIVYDLPYGHGRHFGSNAGYLAQTLLGGWQTDIINSMTSGLPVNLTYTLSANSPLYVTDLYTYRPNVIGQVVAPSSNRVKTATALNGYFNTAATATSVPVGTPFGNAQRNGYLSPAYFDTDFGLHKQFPLYAERAKLELRGEAFNVFNKVNYGAPDGNRSNGTFGAITTAFPARQLQIAAKLIF